jgi:hypothetical protein
MGSTLRLAAITMAFGLAGCAANQPSGSSTGSASVTGSVDGVPVPSAAAYGYAGVTSGAPDASGAVDVMITSVRDTCMLWQDGLLPPSEARLTIEAVAPEPNVPPGKYVLTDGGSNALFTLSDGTCGLSVQRTAVSGWIQLTQDPSPEVLGASVGSFDLTFPGGDHVSGTFEAPYCDANYTSGRPGPTCDL